MKITLVIDKLIAGGAERVLVNLAEGFAEEGHQISVVTLSPSSSDFYSLSSKIPRTALDIAKPTRHILQTLWNAPRRLFNLRRAILKSRPDVVISFMNPVTSLTILALSGKSIPVVVVEQGSPHHFPDTKRNTHLRRWLYPFASHLITPSRPTDAQFSWLSPKKRAVIPNPLPPLNILLEGGVSILNPSKKHILAMGRLAEQKGFDCLIKAFQKIAPHYPEWDFTIIGEGPQRPYLENLIEKSPISGRIFLPGVLKNPFPTLTSADLFILPSRFEPFGNVIIEAMVCSVPVIATKCDGPLEIIQDEVDGLLVEIEDIEGLAGAIQKLISNETLRNHLVTNGLKTAEKYTLANIIPQWESLLEKLIREQ